MGEKHRQETKDERKERKRARKEAKKLKKEQSNPGQVASEGSEEHHKNRLDESPTTTGALPASSKREKATGTKTKPSPFERKRVEIVVSLFPMALGNVLDSVRQSIRSLLLKYSDGIGGILLAFDNVKLVGDSNGSGGHGVILNEMPHIHFHVELDALVFCPAKGVKVRSITATLVGIHPFLFDIVASAFKLLTFVALCLWNH